MQKIVLNLWFDTRAEEAARFYVSLFRHSSLKRITRYGAAAAAVSGMPEGSVLTVEFVLDGQSYIAINGGPVFQFTPAASLMVNCESQEEIDRLWDALTDRGEPSECGWLTDTFGLSWQIVPTALGRMLGDPDPARVERVNAALLKMRKIDLATLEEAYRGD